MECAILLASGLGMRMRPLTESVPKPLIEVGGKPMIETLIEGLQRRTELKKIYVVVGYRGEKFSYLCKKYKNLYIIHNQEYKTVNNISSVYAAREVLGQGACFICEADLVVLDTHIFEGEFKESCYFGRWTDSPTEDWVFDMGEDGYITRVGKAGEKCYMMCGISFFRKEDALLLTEAVERRYKTDGYEQLFWDDVVNENLDSLRLKINPIGENQIVEIDTVEELERIRWRMEESHDKEGKRK